MIAFDQTITFPEDSASRHIVNAQLTNAICTLIATGHPPRNAGVHVLTLYRAFQLGQSGEPRAVHDVLTIIERQLGFSPTTEAD